MADPNQTQNPAAVPPAPPANLGTGQIAPIDVSKGVTVDPRTGEAIIAPPTLPAKPVSSQTIEQPAAPSPAGAAPNDAAFADRLATEQAQNSTGSITDQGTVDVGTPDQNMPQEGELSQGSRIVNPRHISGPARPNLASPSEAVRDEASGATRHMPVDLNAAGQAATTQRLQRVADIATGKAKGLTGEYGDSLGFSSPLVDATLEAMSLGGDVSGDLLAKTLIAQGVEKNTAESIGFAARMLGGLGYAQKMPILLGAPAALGRYAKELGLLGKPVTNMEEAAGLARVFSRASRERQYSDVASLLEEGLRSSGGATVSPSAGHVAIKPDQAAVSVVPGRSVVIEGDATKPQLRKFVKDNADLLEAYPDLSVGGWKDAETGRTHLDLSVVTSPEQAFELGKANRQKSIYLGTGETPRVPHTYSIEEGAKGHGYVPTEKMRAEDVAVAKEYDAAPTVDPEAVPAWRELMDRVRQDVETKILPNLQVEHVNGQPYASAEEMNRDIAAGHLKVSVDNSDHPVWTQDENVLFRIWHDYNQHYLNGADFSLEGEWKAFKTAEQGMSPLARKALQVEIYGQAAAAVAHSGEFQVQKIFLPGKKYAAADTLAEQLAGLRRQQVTNAHSSVADALEAHAAGVLADKPQGVEVFHGTPTAFGTPDMKNGLWVAEQPSTANRYANRGQYKDLVDAAKGRAASTAEEAPNVRPYYLDPSAKLASEDELLRLQAAGMDEPQILAELAGQGYDGVALQNAGTTKGNTYWIFNPNALTEKFTGKTAATMAMIAAAGAAAAAANGEDQNGGAAPLAAMAGVAVMKGKGGKAALTRAEQLARSASGNLRYLVRPIDWAAARSNSKEVNALAAAGASMFARDEVKNPVELMAALAERYGPGVLKHSDVIPEMATKWYEDTLKQIDLRPVEEVLGFFKKGDELPDWYSSGERVKQVFGPDADLVASLIASTSAHNSNERSVEAALHIYAAYKTGKFDPAEAGSVRSWLQKEMKTNAAFRNWSMDTHFNNIERSFLGQEISGNKVWNYKRAIMGDENAVVIDSHMVNTLLPDAKKLKEMAAAGEPAPDWVTETNEAGETVVKKAKDIDISKDAVYKYFEDQVRQFASDHGVTPRYAQQAIWVGKVGAEGRVAESVTPLVDMFKDVAKARGYDSMFPGISDEDTKGLAVLGIASGLLAASAAGEQSGGVTSDHIEAGFPGVAGNRELVKVLVDAVRKLRNIPGKVRELNPATVTEALDVLTAPKATIKAGDKLLGLDWVGMSQDADHLPNTIKTVREAFADAIKADSRGVVSHQMERDMAKTLVDMGYDPEVAVAKWRGGDRSVVSTEIMATAALTKAAYGETERLAQLATKLEGTPAGAKALEDYGRQLGVFGSLVQVLDGQAEEAGRALAVFRSMVPEIPAEARGMAKGEMELAQKGLSPMGGAVAEAATAEGRQAGAGAQAAGQARTAGGRGAFQGPPTPQAVTTVGNAMIQNAQQMQAQYLTGLLQAWNNLPKTQQRAMFLKELGRWGLDLIKEAFYNSMLFTFPGQLANAAGNVLAITGEQLSRIVGAGIGAVRHDVLGLGPAGTSLDQITQGSFLGAVNAVSEAFVAAGKSFATGTPASRGIMGASATRTPYALTGERVQDLAALAGVQIPNAVYHGVNVLGATLGAGSRALLAGDEWMKVVNFRGEIQRLGIEAVEKQGLTGQAASQFLQQWLSSPPSEAIKAARDYAHYVTFTQPLTGTLAAIGTVGHSTLMTPFTPFFDTLVNVQKYELEWIPGLNMLVQKSREDLRHMGPRQDQALAKLGLGSAMMVAAYNLYQAGYITGPGPSDKNVLRTMTEVMKWQPNSFVFTGSDGQKHYVGINRLDPLSFPFAFVAAYGDIALEALNGRAVSQDTAAELALAGVHALGEVAMTRNYAQGFQQAVELLTAKDLKTFNKLQKFGQNLAGQVVPSGVAQVNKEIDPYARATYSALDKIYSRLPGKSTELMPDVNIAGQDRFKTEALGPDWISPLPYSKGVPDVVGQALVDNGVSVPEVPQSLFGPPPPALVGEETSAHGILLDAKQHYRYKHLAGNDLKRPTSEFEPALRAFGYKGELPDKKMGMWDLLTALVQTKAFTDLTPGPQGMQHKVLSSIIMGYRRAAAGQMLKEDKALREKFFGKVLDRAESFGGPRARAQAEQAIRSMDMDAILAMTGNE